MSYRSPRSVVVIKREQAPFAARYVSLPIGPESRPACLYVSLSRGRGRDREGNLRGSQRHDQASPRKGPGQNTESQTFATQRARVRIPSPPLGEKSRSEA